jgi:hypothetical protein
MKKKPRNTLVLASLEGKNNLNKASVIPSAREKERYDRNYRKRQFRSETEMCRRDNHHGWSGGILRMANPDVKRILTINI